MAARKHDADGADWEGIVRRHGALVVRVAWRVLGDAAEAEDCAQEALVEAWRLRQTEEVANWPGLLTRLAVCRAIDRRRARRTILPLDGDANVRSADAGPDDEVAGRELAERLRACLDELPPREAQVFALRFFEDLSYGQIARALDITPGAVGQALFKARAKLEARLIEHDGAPSAKRGAG